MPKPISRFLALLALLFTAVASQATISVAPYSETQLAFDANEDIEPAMISQMRGGVEYNLTVNMKFYTTAASSNPPSQFVSTLITSQGGQSVNTLPSVFGYTQYADPVLAKYDAGLNQPIYLGGLVRDASQGKSAVALWSTTNGGISWTGHGPIVGETEVSPDFYVVDKPAIAVAPDGSIYLAYTRLRANTGEQQIMLTSSIDGGWNWSVPVEVSGPRVSCGPCPAGTIPSFNQSSQIMVDSNGDVYVLWIRWNGNVDYARGIWAKVSRKNGQPRNPLVFNEELPRLTTNVVYGGGAASDNILLYTEMPDPSTTIHHYVRGATVPVAKLDAAHRRIAVTWHERYADHISQVQFAAITIANAGSSWGSWTQDTIARAGGWDLQPGMDFDEAGNFLVAYYSFPNDSTTWAFTYSQVATYVSFPYGNNTPAHETNTMFSGVISNTASYSYTTLFGNPNERLRYLGEYHDVSYTNGTFKTVGIVVVTNGNPWLWPVRHTLP